MLCAVMTNDSEADLLLMAVMLLAIIVSIAVSNVAGNPVDISAKK
jgi:hypothetical protein